MKTQLNSRNMWGGRMMAFLILSAIFAVVKAQPVIDNGSTTIYTNPASRNFAIGLTTAADKLHVSGGGLLVTGNIGTTAVSGPGTRLMWIPSKSAFRAGGISGTQWDDANIGISSVAMGYDTKASEAYTTAIGRGNSATAVDATAIGNFNSATGSGAIAMGTWVSVSGTASVGMGGIVNASGNYCTAIGTFVGATGDYAGAFGFYTGAHGEASWAAGAYLHSDSSHSVTIGNGVDQWQPLVNDVPRSIMLGTNSDLPTLVIQKANGAGTTGSVGIGTTDVPTNYKLAVKGGIIAEEMRVELFGNWPDTVFSPDYKLMKLSETEEYIAAHGHLPNIPSAAEVAKDGINLGEMNVKLMEKVEEITLHLIRMEKELKALEAVNTELRNR